MRPWGSLLSVGAQRTDCRETKEQGAGYNGQIVNENLDIKAKIQARR